VQKKYPLLEELKLLPEDGGMINARALAPYAGGPPPHALSFSGLLQQGTDERRIILVENPLAAEQGGSPRILEFMANDIAYVESLPDAVTAEGDAVPLARIWVREGGHGFEILPFTVGEMEARNREKG
jgi:hypothetical protein